MKDEHRPSLRALSDRVGIVPEYVDQSGRETRRTSDATRELLLTALGFEVSSEAGTSAALRRLDEREAARLIPTVQVVRGVEEMPRTIRVRPPDGWDGSVAWEIELEGSGLRMRAEGEARADGTGTLTLPLLGVLHPDYYTARVRLHRGGESREDSQRLIVSPRQCLAPDAARRWGVVVNLYTARSRRNWGVGDFSDLRNLVRWTATVGGDFVGLNPLHAIRNRGDEISPYSPISRLWRNPLYLDIEAIPELKQSAQARALLGQAEVKAALEEVRLSELVRYADVMKLKRRLLEPLHRTFALCHRDSGTERGVAYHAFVEERGESLENFCMFMALEEHFARTAPEVGWWREWPDAFRDHRSAQVLEFGAQHREEVDFHRWVQFELYRQLGECAEEAHRSGMSLGLYQDLAIGASGNSADVWSYPHLFVDGVALGAPPDMYAPQGQNWGLPPVSPLALREDRYEYMIRLVRGGMRHASALRIDHILGFFRQFWIPDGHEGRDGAYVRFPTTDLFAILAIESHRAGALVVGEDLGTVPPEVPPTLEDWGILSSKVLYFERENDGGFKSASSYPPLSLTTANTHDMATINGWWRGLDVDIRERHGMLDEYGAREAREEREREKRRLLERLHADGVLPDGSDPATLPELRGAVHTLLTLTPSALVGVSLDDIVGEDEPINVPGVGLDDHPSWSRRQRLPIEELDRDPDVRPALPRRPPRGDA